MLGIRLDVWFVFSFPTEASIGESREHRKQAKKWYKHPGSTKFQLFVLIFDRHHLIYSSKELCTKCWGGVKWWCFITTPIVQVVKQRSSSLRKLSKFRKCQGQKSEIRLPCIPGAWNRTEHLTESKSEFETKPKCPVLYPVLCQLGSGASALSVSFNPHRHPGGQAQAPPTLVMRNEAQTSSLTCLSKFEEPQPCSGAWAQEAKGHTAHCL